MAKKTADQVREIVQKSYADVATKGTSCCGGGEPCDTHGMPVQIMTDRLGYTQEDLQNVPEGSNMGLGCGNPQAIAALQPGEVVLDLGCGGGFDCFLAAKRVGDRGQVIGVDMTPEMVRTARENAAKGNYRNVDFRLGEIEHLPVADGTVDVILSNCVINLSPDKAAVYREALRVLKPGGRLAISDVVATAEIPEEVKNDEQLLCGCVAGAEHIDRLTALLAECGFTDVKVEPKDESREFIKDWAPDKKIDDFVVSANITASKPLR